MNPPAHILPGIDPLAATPRRSCEGCTACCTVMPVSEFKKPGFTRCRHQGLGCCAIYATRPRSCKAWSCGYLLLETALPELRPDRSGVVIDMLLADIGYRFNDTGEFQNSVAVQMWLGDDAPEAHRTRAVRQVIAHFADTYGLATMLRIGAAQRGVAVFAPSLGHGGWREIVMTLDPALSV